MRVMEKLKVLYCHGLGSSINNRHGVQLQEYFGKKFKDSVYFERLIYSNPGSTEAVWNINEWKNDIKVRIGNEKWVLMATSGACHAVLNIAKEQAENVQGLFLFCPGTHLDMTFVDTIAPGALQLLKKRGKLIYPPSRNGYAALLTVQCLQEFLDTCVSQKEGMIDINCPVTVCHGTLDTLVPYQNSVKLVERLKSKNVDLVTIENGTHYFDIDEKVEKKLDNFMKQMMQTKTSKL